MQQEMRFENAAATRAIKNLLDDPRLGQIYLIFRGAELAGYFALTFCFSLEFHGRFALLDEVYLLEPFRRQKLGKASWRFCEDMCRKAGIRRCAWKSAAKTHRRNRSIASGFAEDARNLMTKWL